MKNINLLAVVTPQYIFIMVDPLRRRSGTKSSQARIFFSDMNMKNCGHRNVRKHRDIKGSDKYVTLDISLKFDSLDKMKFTSSESKENLEISGKGLIISLGFKAKVRPHKYKKERYAIRDVSKKDLSKIIWKFEKLL